MRSKRQKRVADQLREILSELLMYEAEDPRLSGITIMDVDIDRELMYADVFVSSLDGDNAREEVLGALETAKGFLRREMGTRMRLQHTPELRFHWDESLGYGDRIENLLSSLDTSSAQETESADDDAE
jgi:ribosome-binding factor A